MWQIESACLPQALMESSGFSVGWETGLVVGDTLPAVSQLLIANFFHFQSYSRADCRLRWATLRCNDVLIGAAPVVQLPRCPIPSLLNTFWRTRLNWLSPFFKRNIILVDTSFLAYLPISPILGTDDLDAASARQRLCEFIWDELSPDSLTVTEPEQRAYLGVPQGWDQYTTLPIALIDLAKHSSFEDYVRSLSQKRRRNLRKEQQAFSAASGTIEHTEGPLSQDSDILHELINCLKASESRARIVAPYNSVMIDQAAFASQRQTLFIARIGGKIVGFMSFLRDRDNWLQLHGGFDYQQSLTGYAYHNLIYHAIERAIDADVQGMLMGPLNNEAKRRASTKLLPMVNCVKQRSGFDRLLSRLWLYKRLGAYAGPFEPFRVTKPSASCSHWR